MILLTLILALLPGRAFAVQGAGGGGGSDPTRVSKAGDTMTGSLTMSGAAQIISGSSVTAGNFIGDARHLINIPAATVAQNGEIPFAGIDLTYTSDGQGRFNVILDGSGEPALKITNLHGSDRRMIVLKPENGPGCMQWWNSGDNLKTELCQDSGGNFDYFSNPLHVNGTLTVTSDIDTGSGNRLTVDNIFSVGNFQIQAAVDTNLAITGGNSAAGNSFGIILQGGSGGGGSGSGGPIQMVAGSGPGAGGAATVVGGSATSGGGVGGVALLQAGGGDGGGGGDAVIQSGGDGGGGAPGLVRLQPNGNDQVDISTFAAVFEAGELLAFSGPPFTVNACGTNTPDPNATDTTGEIAVSAGGVTSCQIVFAVPRNNNPFCTATVNGVAATASISSKSNTQVTFSFSAAIDGGSFDYTCFGQ